MKFPCIKNIVKYQKGSGPVAVGARSLSPERSSSPSVGVGLEGSSPRTPLVHSCVVFLSSRGVLHVYLGLEDIQVSPGNSRNARKLVGHPVIKKN